MTRVPVVTSACPFRWTSAPLLPTGCRRRLANDAGLLDPQARQLSEAVRELFRIAIADRESDVRGVEGGERRAGTA
jgi:hypothetical protein